MPAFNSFRAAQAQAQFERLRAQRYGLASCASCPDELEWLALQADCLERTHALTNLSQRVLGTDERQLRTRLALS